ncbi:MAG TPA: copper chaperone PCu(A)C [Burkholderiales bacterium]|nr:copper chaperone PCu(A)C [Burkholderiales bacterium]
MRLLIMALVMAALPAFAHSFEKGDLQIRHPWSRATPPGAKVGVGYLEIRNNGAQPDRLLSASTSVAKRVEMHVTEQAGEVAKMRQLRAFEVPGRERLALEPGGAHLMLVDLVQPLKKGERFGMTLRFERAGEVEVQFEVQEMGARHSRH